MQSPPPIDVTQVDALTVTVPRPDRLQPQWLMFAGFLGLLWLVIPPAEQGRRRRR